MSQLIYPAVLLIFCRGLPLAGSELHGNLYFFMFCQPGSFFINALSLTNTLLWNEQQTLTWFFRYKKKNWNLTVSSILAATVIGHFSGIFRIRSSSISAYSRRLKDNTSLKPFVMYSLSIYFSSIQHRRESRVYHWGRKGSGWYSDVD